MLVSSMRILELAKQSFEMWAPVAHGLFRVHSARSDQKNQDGEHICRSYLYMHLYVHICIDIYIYAYSFTYVFMCVYVYMCIEIYICVYVYLYVYVCVYVYIYIYICTSPSRSGAMSRHVMSFCCCPFLWGSSPLNPIPPSKAPCRAASECCHASSRS